MSVAVRVAFLVFFLCIGEAASAAVSVLFIGNSLTQVNNLPSVFQHFAAASSLHLAINVRSVTPGGATLADQWKSEQGVALLRNYHPNFLILQGQSTEPLSASQDFNYYARLFKTEADQIGTKTVLFSTWARPATDSYYKDPSSGGSPFEMQIRLNTAYLALAKNIGAMLAPVGTAFQHAKEVAPKIELLDGSQHPSPAGTYLAAGVLFRTLFNASAIGSSYFGGLSEPSAHTLQRIADQVPIGVTER